MGARSYIPQLGRFLQPDPAPGGSASAYAYTFGDPVNSSDPTGTLTYGFASWLKEANNQEAQEVVAREVARETLEREEQNGEPGNSPPQRQQQVHRPRLRNCH